jgi:hypothetical protein
LDSRVLERLGKQSNGYKGESKLKTYSESGVAVFLAVGASRNYEFQTITIIYEFHFGGSVISKVLTPEKQFFY